tara:strand:+ start:62 stop:274 length:213 start_codon:yes stop_codon:yes gene_type:complete
VIKHTVSLALEYEEQKKAPQELLGGLKITPAATYSPTGKTCSTIGAGRLNFRVRDGIGCSPAAITTGKWK